MQTETVQIHTEFIKLQDLLKYAGAAGTGGDAKLTNADKSTIPFTFDKDNPAHFHYGRQAMHNILYTVANSNDIETVVRSMVGKVDVIYAPTDNVIAAGMPTVAMIANENKLPTIVGEKGMCDAGGLATYSIDYKELGKLAGDMAVRILTEGADPAEMPIEYYPSDKLQLIVNEDTAAELGIDVSGLEADAE